MDTKDAEDFEYSSPRLDDSISLQNVALGKVDVYVRPAPRIVLGGEHAEEYESDAIRLLQVDVVKGLLTTFPMSNIDIPFRKVMPKYDQIERISWDGGKVAFSAVTEHVTQDEPQGKFLGGISRKDENYPSPFQGTHTRTRRYHPKHCR